ncbi:hypothetical protein GGR54DRAFT_618911 [Hypoxylon sp. NC1633]|nr:hypothetical protein GGR54DRAFT_618911 [Hypoxylon sp. NC1633]
MSYLLYSSSVLVSSAMLPVSDESRYRTSLPPFNMENYTMCSKEHSIQRPECEISHDDPAPWATCYFEHISSHVFRTYMRIIIRRGRQGITWILKYA